MVPFRQMELSLPQLQMDVHLCIFLLFLLESLIPGALVSSCSICRQQLLFMKTILEAGVKIGNQLISSMNAQSTGIDFVVNRVYGGNPAWLAY